MSRIVLSTSSSGLDNMNIDHQVELIRLRIHVNNVEFIDGKNISIERLEFLMNDMTRSPVHTSPAPSHEVVKIFSELQNRGIKEVFITTLSSQISESYAIISEVAKSFADTMDIYVYDTKDLNVCEALLALQADDMMRQGVPMRVIARHLDTLRDAHQMLFVTEDLSYLINNKKISGTAGWIANLFSIKPVLQVSDEGLIIPISKIRKLEKALDYMINEFAEVVNQDNSFCYILSTGCHDLDQYFKRLVKAKTNIQSIAIISVSAISLANHGPTGVGLCVFNGHIPLAASLFDAA